MKADQTRRDPSLWRPQARFSATIASLNQLKTFNDTGGIAVYLDVERATAPAIEISGSQTEMLSFWETRSPSGFVTTPKFSAGLLTVRFVTRGHIVYAHRQGDILASPAIAALTGFDDLREVRASSAVGAVSATIAVDALAAANDALTGRDHAGLPALAPIADMTMPGLRALFCTIRLIRHRLQDLDRGADLMLPLLQEVMSYQLLSAWPKRVAAPAARTRDVAASHLRLAIEYIEANLSTAMTLADIAAAVGTGVRSLQTAFRKELGRTPVQFIIERRLTRAHEDLTAPAAPRRPIAAIARAWGFAHMSDFGQRYRRRYGCTPSETRRQHERAR
ncbi:helix-turn-helix transcriptional regulator (plasmid) [Methylobacterium sp. NMS14P]|uniref:helix-turn-helix transcriptional regulator n=1 Tax=Methylobacterium sp. NMS14P TaxID=2894310 RepID=UPI0023590692|nr:helix-turn-helix transcriptional regulator [Methylobacterium sp. NMS14P]WCS28446.1 helix-turn-helix transcriptional regulator [Methylobacterium sp. NMS14P]